MKIPKVSIIIPVYNAETHICRCIISIIEQTFIDFEVIIINDCSSDKSLIMITDLIKNDYRFRVLNHSENLGAMCTRETGYKNASSNYIIFLDSDDFIPNNSIQILYDKIIKENSDIVIGKSITTNTSNKITPSYTSLSKNIHKKDIINLTLKGSIPANLCGKIHKKKLLSNTFSIKNMSMSEDTLLTFEFLEQVDKITIINDPVYYYYLNQSSTTHNIKLKEIESKIFTTKFIYDKYSSKKNFNKYMDLFVIKSIGKTMIYGLTKEEIIKYYDFVDINELMSIKKIFKSIPDYKALASFLIFNSKLFRNIIIPFLRI